MIETATREQATLMNGKRWLTPLLITAYIVAVLLISGFSKALDKRTVAPIGETSKAHR